jgi:hypothetical protein
VTLPEQQSRQGDGAHPGRGGERKTSNAVIPNSRDPRQAALAPDSERWKDDAVILVCYDGSVDAQSAIDRAAALMPAESAAVLTVWNGLAELLARRVGVRCRRLGFREHRHGKRAVSPRAS